MDFMERHARLSRARHAAVGGQRPNQSWHIQTDIPVKHHHHFPAANLIVALAIISVSAGALYWNKPVTHGPEQSRVRPSANAGGRVATKPRPPRHTASRVKTTAAETVASTMTPDDSQTEPATTPENLYRGEQPARPTTTIDKLVFNKLSELKITPSKLCSDGVFLRRAYIAVLGTIPTAAEARRFLEDPDPHKRARLIDELLERPEFADYSAMKWCDVLRVKAEFPINLWPNATQAYHAWIRTAIEEKLPFDQFAVQLLTSSGSNFRNPPVNFYRAVQDREPKGLAHAVALIFLSQRADNWPPEKLEGMAKFFSRVGYKPTGEWKEEIIYFNRHRSRTESGRASLTATFPDGRTVDIPPEQDPREVFATWLTDRQNREFPQSIANRIWYWLYGRGIVDEPDDMRPDNPPVLPELLELLANELIASDYDSRHLHRLILNSQTFQLSCIPESDDPQAGRYFASFPVRRLDAEVLIDAICKITGTTEVYSSIIPEPFTFLPDDQRAVALPDGSITSSFLEMFGRPTRDTGLASERNAQLSAAQSLHLLNSNHIRRKIYQSDRIKDLLMSPESASEVYIALLSRRPTDPEYALSLGMSAYGPTRDLVWALINSDEFLFQH